MTDKDRKEIRKIIREEIEAKLSSRNRTAPAPQQHVVSVKSDQKGQINIDTVSPAY